MTARIFSLLFLALASTTTAFVPLSHTPTTSTRLASSNSDGSPNEEQYRKILQEEAMNAENLKASAKEMQNLKPGQIDDMLKEMETMPSWQKDQLKKMGMDPDIMKASMQQMKENPELLKTMGNMMENMTPDELMQQSKMAQDQMKMAQASAAGGTSTSAIPAVADAEIVKEDDDEEEEEEDSEPIEPNPEVLDAMFEVAKIMGNGKVTLAAFSSLPVVTLLAGNGDDDLDQEELTDCWNKGSLGATSVDRTGFERIWREIQDNYYSDIVEEAQLRMPSKRRSKKRGSTAKPAAVPPASTTPTVGANISPELLQAQMKNMSDDDMKNMFEQMTDMTPEQEARMKAMGADPAMLKKSAEMMKNNPLLRKAAQTMMKNTSPEQMMKASQEAQERMKNMSEEEKKKMMDGMGM